MSATKKEVKAIRLPKVQNKLGDVSKATVYRLVAEGRIPPPFKIGKRASAWLESSIDEAILTMHDSK